MLDCARVDMYLQRHLRFNALQLSLRPIAIRVKA
jgi:hypothetical protein